MNKLYNEEYFLQYDIGIGIGKVSYEDSKYTKDFLETVAEKIVLDFHPQTVLDAGCAMGYLVAALRDRGVEAYGVDISDYAISKVREDIKPYCVVGSLTEPLPDSLPKRYDLIVSIEVLEHLYEDDGKKAIANLCTYSDRILLSSTPDDFEEITHVNVQQREYWAKMFAEQGFFDEINYSPRYITPYAVCFSKNIDLVSCISDYERALRITKDELKRSVDEYQKLYEKSPFSKVIFTGKLYLDIGNGYHEEKALDLQKGELENHFHYKIDLPINVKKIRFDPVDGIACIIGKICFITNQGIIPYKTCNGFVFDAFALFLHTDPQFELDMEGSAINFVEIYGEIALIDSPITLMLLEKTAKYRDGLAVLQRVQEQLTLQNELKIEEIRSQKDRETEEVRAQCYEKFKILEERQNELEHIAAEKQRAQEALKSQLNDALQNYAIISNAACWKVTKPVRMILNGIKKVLKSNKITYKLCRGVKRLKENGLFYTMERIKLKIKSKRSCHTFSANNQPSAEELTLQKEESFPNAIKFSVLVPLYNTPQRLLKEMIDSVVAQTYPNWELCLCDGSDKEHGFVEEVCLTYAKADGRILYQKLKENLGISDNTNACAQMAQGDYIVLFDHDDILHPSALYENAKAIEQTGADVLYSDEDHITEDGKHINPFFKPDWSPDLLYSQMYICHLLVFKRDLFERVGGFRREFDGSQDYDLMLRFSEETQHIYHIPKILYSWRETQNSTASNADSKPYAHIAGQMALDEHLKRKYGAYAHGENSEYTFVYEARFDTMKGSPKISIIIPMRDKWQLSDTCIDSILVKSTYQNYEILILDNCSKESETFAWFDSIQKRDERIRVVSADMEFNWSKLNNFGMKEADGEVYVFLNNDTVVITPDWIEKLCENALRDDIGLVGPLLTYEDETIQHAGVVVGIGGWADHIFKGMRQVHYGCPYVSSMISRNVLAVTGACMAVSKKTIEKIGKFDEEFIICGSDVELCIRAYEKGLNNLYNARVKLYHLESKSRDSFIPEIDFKKSHECYGPYRENIDPYFNVNLDINQVKPTERGEPVNISIFKNYIKRASLTAPLYRELKKMLSDFQVASTAYSIAEVEPVYARQSKVLGDKMRINLLIPSVDKQHVFGGISTALKFFDALVEAMQVDARIITMDSPINKDTCVLLNGYIRVDSDEDSALPKQLTEFSNRYHKTIPVGKNDIFVSTGWWTAYVISEVIQWQAQIFHSECNKMIYLIQDYEPGFYSWSSRYIMADSTYRLNIPTIAVFNSKLLKDYFISSGYKFYRNYYFEPVLNDTLRKILLSNQGPAQRKKQILVYGRPSTQRNAFELIVAALNKWCRIQENVSEWTVLSAGEQHSDVDLGNGMRLHSVGKLSLEEYGKVMLESFIGLSLMVSPHPSYPPLEMSTFGMKTITNCYMTKDLSAFNQNIISLKNCSQDTVAQEIKKLCDHFDTNGQVCINKDYVEGVNVFDEIIEEIKMSLLESAK